MFHGHYDTMVQFASEGALAEELSRAKAEYFERTGELFDTDEQFERRMASFLEWYVFDRSLADHNGLTPARLCIDAHRERFDSVELARMEEIASSSPSLFEFRKLKKQRLHVIDLLTNTRHSVFERREPAGLDTGDILESRLVPYDGELYFSEVWAVHPREARRTILRVAKAFRKSKGDGEARIDLVHRVARLANRCERYKHVDPKQIFEELVA
ncbi:MAG: hypothetical protein AAF735_05325 [Myxococcota bacterium]